MPLGSRAGDLKEEIVKSRIYVIAIVSIVIAPLIGAAPVEERAKLYQPATVLSVDRQEVTGPNQCCYSGTDAPMQNEYYAYQVAIRVACGTYVGRYETPFDYLPSAFTPNKTVQVRLTKHILYFDVPGEREMKMGIVHHNNERAAPCDTTSARR
jgi:hypothetical protein